MSQKPPRRLSDILRENEKKNSGKKIENPKKIKRRTRRGRTGRSLSQLLKGDTEKKAKKEVNSRWTRKNTQPKIYNPTTDWELDALFAPMPGITLSEEYRLNHLRNKEKSNSSNVNRKEFLDGDQLKMDKILEDAMDGIGKKKKRPRKRRKRRKRAKKSKKQIRKKNRRISRKRDKR